MRKSLTIGVHIALGLAAFGVMYVGKTAVESRGETNISSTGEDAALSQQDRRHSARKTATKPHLKSAQFKEAWDAIPSKKWSRAERFENQLRLLEAWAEVDLEGALKAALAESWRDGNMRIEDENFVFRRAFAEVFVNRSEDVWKLIQSRSPGILESAVLLDAWTTTLISADSDAFLGYLKEMDTDQIADAMEPVWRSKKNKDFVTKMLGVLAEKMESGTLVEGLDSPFFSEVGQVFTHQELIDRLIHSKESSRKFHASLVAGEFVENGKNGNSLEEFASHIEAMPSEVRGDVAKALLSSNTVHPNIMRAALASLVEGQQWELFDNAEISRAMRRVERGTDPVELADWVMTMPPREETAEIFHRGVEPYIRHEPSAAWNWIQKMDDGFWRDRALAEYSQIHLYQFKDTEKSAAALSQISDPAFRARAKGWRRDWENRK